jgi:hypothetical protein
MASPLSFSARLLVLVVGLHLFTAEVRSASETAFNGAPTYNCRMHAANALKLEPRRLGILPAQSKSLFSAIWKPTWVILCALIGKSALIALIGLFYPEGALWLLKERKGVRKTIGPLLSGTVTTCWAVLFTPDIPTKCWLQRRALHRAAQRQPERALEMFSRHYLLKAPRVSTPILTPDSGKGFTPLSRDELINDTPRRDAFLIVISGRGGAGKSSLALDIGRALMLGSEARKRRSLPVVLDKIPGDWDEKKSVLDELGRFVSTELNVMTLPPPDPAHAASQTKPARPKGTTIDAEMAIAGLRSGQVCLIVDGLSEMEEKFRKQLSNLSSENQIKKLVITTRDADADVPRMIGKAWTVPPLEGAPLAQFVEDYFSNLCRNDKIITTAHLFNNSTPLAQFLRGYEPNPNETLDTFVKRASSKIVGEHFASPWSSRSTCLSVTLRIKSLIKNSKGDSLFGLCHLFFSDLIQHLKGDRSLDLNQIVKDFMVLSLNVLRKYKFRIGNFSTGEPFLERKALNTFIDDVCVIEVDRDRLNASFICDPIAEWLGAAQMLRLQ